MNRDEQDNSPFLTNPHTGEELKLNKKYYVLPDGRQVGFPGNDSGGRKADSQTPQNKTRPLLPKQDSTGGSKTPTPGSTT